MQPGLDLEARSDNKWTPLHLAAQSNDNPAVVQALIAAGADLEARNDYKETPLHLAKEYNGNPAVREALLAAGAGRVERQLAAARKTRTKKSRGGGSGFGALVAGIALATTARAAGASTEDAVGTGGLRDNRATTCWELWGRF